MKMENKKNQMQLYQCSECGFKYESKEWAQKCETWCKEHHTCNIEIISHAIAESEKPPK